MSLWQSAPFWPISPVIDRNSSRVAWGKPLGQTTFCARDEVHLFFLLCGARQNESVPGFRVSDRLRTRLAD